jgi:hypothetical protein
MTKRPLEVSHISKHSAIARIGWRFSLKEAQRKRMEGKAEGTGVWRYGIKIKIEMLRLCDVERQI